MAGRKTLKSIPILNNLDQSEKLGEMRIKKRIFSNIDFVFAPQFRILEMEGEKVNKVELISVSLISDKEYKEWEK